MALLEITASMQVFYCTAHKVGSRFGEAMRDVYQKGKGAIAYVAVETRAGDESIGTAFHIGDGYFITAKHVLEGNRLLELATTQPLTTFTNFHNNHINEETRPRTISVVGEPILAAGDVDVAIIRTELVEDIPSIKLCSTADIYQSEDTVLLSSVICIGYPPIPLTTHPFQVVVSGNINALIRVRGSEYLTYVISATSRGGFSGGPVLNESGNAIGLVTESLVKDNQQVETGFFTCLSISAAASLALQSGWSPSESAFYPDVESLAWVKLALPETCRLNPHAHDVSIYVYDDDRDVFVTFSCCDPDVVGLASSAFAMECPLLEPQLVGDGWVWVPKGNPSSSQLEKATIAALDALVAAGFRVVSQRFSGGRTMA